LLSTAGGFERRFSHTSSHSSGFDEAYSCQSTDVTKYDPAVGVATAIASLSPHTATQLNKANDTTDSDSSNSPQSKSSDDGAVKPVIQSSDKYIMILNGGDHQNKVPVNRFEKNLLQQPHAIATDFNVSKSNQLESATHIHDKESALVHSRQVTRKSFPRTSFLTSNGYFSQDKTDDVLLNAPSIETEDSRHTSRKKAIIVYPALSQQFSNDEVFNNCSSFQDPIPCVETPGNDAGTENCNKKIDILPKEVQDKIEGAFSPSNLEQLSNCTTSRGETNQIPLSPTVIMAVKTDSSVVDGIENVVPVPPKPPVVASRPHVSFVDIGYYRDNSFEKFVKDKNVDSLAAGDETTSYKVRFSFCRMLIFL